MICVTGVSGSGKSSLVDATLRRALSCELYRSYERPLEYDRIEGIEHIDKLIVVDQSPIGRTPRSNPATYSERASATSANCSSRRPTRRFAGSRRAASRST